MPFEPIEHTADTGLRVWAPDRDGLFAESARAVIAVMGSAAGEARRTQRVELQADDLEALLVDWLSEVLFLFEARDLVPVEVSVRVTENPWRLVASLGGPDASGFETSGPAVKAVTFHGLEVGPADGGWEARVYLDV